MTTEPVTPLRDMVTTQNVDGIAPGNQPSAITREDKAYELLRRYNLARDEVRRLHATDASRATIAAAQAKRDQVELALVQCMSAGIEP